MRAGRLLEILLLLQNRGRLTAVQLADELEVSVRTVLRDIEAMSGAGVPVRAIRGRTGGFELLDGYQTGLQGPETWGPRTSRPGPARRAAIRISPEGRRIAAVLGRLQPIRLRRQVDPDEHGWVEATFRLGQLEGTALDLLSLGAEVEVLTPPQLRARVATLAAAVCDLYRESE